MEEGQVVLCTVEKIIGTTIFVKIKGDGEGTISMSEIAPGRIRNLREYVFPGKTIVCKILNSEGTKRELSLRRVKPNEKKDLLARAKKEKSYAAMLKTILGEKTKEIIENITKEHDLIEILEHAKTDTKSLDTYLSKDEKEKLIKILETKKEKVKEIKQTITVTSKEPNGIVIIKKLLVHACEKTGCAPTYIAAGKYVLTIKGEDFKDLKQKMQQTVDILEEKAKEQHAEFAVVK